MESQEGQPARYAASPPTVLPHEHEHALSAGKDQEESDIERLFQQGQGLEAWDEAPPRKPVARHKWHCRAVSDAAADNSKQCSCCVPLCGHQDTD